MPDTSSLVNALTAQMADVLGAMTGVATRAMPAVGASEVDWHVPVLVSGTATGTVSLGLSADGARHLVGAILGDAATVVDADITDTLRELLGQAAAAHVHGAGHGVLLDVGTAERSASAAPTDARQFDLMIGAAPPLRLVAWGRISSTRTERPRTPPALPAAGGGGTAPRNLDVVLDIELPISVRFGETQMTLDALARLGPGSMIDLERAPDDPVDVLVNGRLVARGQVVVVSGCYGVRINEVVSPADRLRSIAL
ncbi:MAG: flagellar motor switch protein FliN [Luteitalea sp.]